ncbi:acetyl-CoA synthetase-like protein [Zopfia rhizophila CBS 207.26]|uniref:Acetyl-CoA synthetase-like protein n=1 Tax=Zopfia rhizophila CBS 207.26 TaxID=1314779 RepID=A0A6A6DQU7_9PEZI|nr:acetyl-CoA synthetase-like protein [Zopfia rhizophila CBS 207.26]
MGSSSKPWPNGRRKLLNHLVDEIARDNPNAVYAELPRSPDTYEDGFRQITFKDLSNAINGMAWWIERTLGKGNLETLVYFGPNDMAQVLLILGAVKAGYKMLFPSPTYSPAAHANLLQQSNSTALLVPAIRPSVIDTVLEVYELEVFQIPSVLDLLNGVYSHFEFSRTFEEAEAEPLVVLPTSGTTGFPKPVIWTHGWADSYAGQRYASLAPPEDSCTPESTMLGVRTLCLCPPSHASSMFVTLLFTIYCGNTVIMPLSGPPISAKMGADALLQTNCDFAVMIPPHLEQLGSDKELLERFNVKGIMWGGADISVAAGEAVSSKIKLFTVAGSTEMGMWANIRPAGPWNPELWHHMRFHPSENVEFVERAEGLYEAVIHRNNTGASESSYEQPIFKIFPDVQKTYETGDLFTAHPTVQNLWRHFGRADDMQIFLSGEKYYPAEIEKSITRHADQAALLLQVSERLPTSTKGERSEAMEKVWPAVEEANKVIPAYAKVAKSHVILIPGNQPMPRTVKGTIQKQAVINMYQKELNDLE